MLLEIKPIQWAVLLTLAMLAIPSVTISLEKPSAEEQTSTLKTPQLDVFKSPTCGCCQKWIEHVENNGFSTTTHHPVDLAAVKSSYGIQGKYRSCHTTVSSDGYVFEGHVPAKYIRQFMLDKPAKAIGLSVPAMPIGSPGMEVKERFTPYQILMLFKDGTSKVYAEINNYGEQF